MSSLFSSLYCGVCKRKFNKPHHFDQHLVYNDICRHFHGGKSRSSDRIIGSYGTSRRRRSHSQVSERSDPSDKGKVAAQFSEFTFHDFDSDEEYQATGSKLEGMSRKLAVRETNQVAPTNDSLHFPSNNTNEASGSDTDDYVEPTAPTQAECDGPRIINEPLLEPDRTFHSEFRDYCDYAAKNYVTLPTKFKAAIELIDMLDRKGCPGSLYEEIFSWHLKYINATQKVTEKELYKKLLKRYDLEACKPFEVPIQLPCSKTRLNLVCHDFRAQLKDLLSDPHVKPSDYIWFGDDPTNPPPPEFETVGDINTGRCYRSTYKDLIGDDPTTEDGRTKALLGLQQYIDGCVTGQFDKLPLEILKFTVCIFGRTFRDSDEAWRNLGYVTKFVKGQSEAEDIILNSSHADASRYMKKPKLSVNDTPNSGSAAPEFDLNAYINDDGEDDDDPSEPKIPEIPAQDFHKMLQVMLSGLKTVQQSGGIPWDLEYKGKIYPLQLIPFMMNVKGDTVEADKHCGSYGSRGKGVSQLCRYCCCPAPFSDHAYRDDPPKTVEMIQNLVKLGDTDALKKLSQQQIFNAWYEIQFGTHDKSGVHGCCCMEVLHWLNIGWYKYARANLFEQTGPSSNLSKHLNETAIHLGILLQRQSDREFPRTKFNAGVKKGKLMGHEMCGMMLVLAGTLTCTRGKELILEEARGKQREFLPNDEFIADWVMLIEKLLCFEEWLKQDELPVKSVNRASVKVRELMELHKIVGKRTSGMGNKTMNFHGTKHVPTDILNFGVPMNIDTGPNERHHKRDKKTAKKTQRRPGTFDLQVALKIIYRRCIDLGMQELAGRPKWNYYEGFNHFDVSKEVNYACGVSGVRTDFWFDAEGKVNCKVVSEMRHKKRFSFPAGTLDQVHQLLYSTEEYLSSVSVYTEYWVLDPKFGPKKQIYRASPLYDGREWYDWCMMDCRPVDPDDPTKRIGSDIEPVAFTPCQLMCFVDLQGLPHDQQIGIAPGIYCVGEPSTEVKPEPGTWPSDLFEPYLKDSKTILGKTQHAIDFWPCDRILEPTSLIPDLDHEDERAFLRVVPRWQWADLFEQFVQQPHTRNFNVQQSKRS